MALPNGTAIRSMSCWAVILGSRFPCSGRISQWPKFKLSWDSACSLYTDALRPSVPVYFNGFHGTERRRGVRALEDVLWVPRELIGGSFLSVLVTPPQYLTMDPV